MILQETRLMIKHLAREGVPKSRIAAQMGVSRQTVYNQLKHEGAVPKPRPERTSKLDAFKAYLRSRLESFDLPATTLLAEIRQRGYRGGITILREFVRSTKQQICRRVTERFETVPGQQAQIDWGECGTIVVGGQRRRLYCFVFVLGYSRMMYARFTTSTRTAVLLGCLQQALRALGIPKEILVDNMKQAVEEHDARTGTVRWNRQFLGFCEHFGFLPLASPPYWPRVKGKVERGVGYVKRSFLEGRSFTDLHDLNQQLEAWLDAVANVRIHGTTGERPAERYGRDEARALRAAPAVPAYDTRPLEVRQVPSDCHISYGGVRYSVDPKAARRVVHVRAEGEDVGDTFTVYLAGEVVAHHVRRPKGTGRVTLPEHAEAIRRLTRGSAAAQAHAARRGKQPRFEQTEQATHEGAATAALERLRRAAPEVEVRSLALFDALLLAAGPRTASDDAGLLLHASAAAHASTAASTAAAAAAAAAAAPAAARHALLGEVA